MTISYDSSVPLEQEDSSALLNYPSLIPKCSPSSSFSLFTSSSSYTSPIPLRSLYLSPRIPTNISKPTIALSKHHHQHFSLSHLKMHHSTSQPASPRRNSDQFYRPPSSSQHLLRDTLRKDERSRQSSPSSPRIGRSGKSVHNEEDSHFGSIGDGTRFTGSDCICREACEECHTQPRPRLSPASAALSDYSGRKCSGCNHSVTKPVAVRRQNSTSSRNSIPVANSGDSSSNGRYLHIRPQGKARNLPGSPPSPSPLPPILARSKTAPMKPAMITTTPALPMTPSSSTNSLAQSPDLKSRSELTSLSSQLSGGAQESHASNVNTNLKLSEAGKYPAIGKLRSPHHPSYHSTGLHHYIPESSVPSLSTTSSPNSSPYSVSSLPLSPNYSSEKLQKNSEQLTSIRPDMKRSITETGLRSKSRLHAFSVDSPPLHRSQLDEYKHEGSEGQIKFMSPHEAVLKARLEGLLLRAAGDDRNTPHHSNRRSKSHSMSVGQGKSWEAQCAEDEVDSNLMNFSQIPRHFVPPLTPGSSSPDSSHESIRSPISPPSTPPKDAITRTPPSLSFDARVALETCKRMDGYVSFASVEGLGSPADLEVEALNTADVAEEGENEKKWGKWWRVWMARVDDERKH